MVRRAALAALLAVVALGAVAACDDEPEPKIDDDPTPSVTTEPTESVSASQSPGTELDPEATVRAWVDDWNAARASGDISKMREYEAATCHGCDELVGPVEDIIAAGGKFDGGEWSILAVKVTKQTDQEAEVGLGVEIAAGSTTPSSDASPSPYPASKHLLNLILVREDNRWRFSVVDVLS